MSGDSVWELVGGGEILFVRVDDEVEAQHASRSRGSFGFIGRATSQAAAECMARNWLRRVGLTRRGIGAGSLARNP